jgi:hypothetical protein
LDESASYLAQEEKRVQRGQWTVCHRASTFHRPNNGAIVVQFVTMQRSARRIKKPRRRGFRVMRRT